MDLESDQQYSAFISHATEDRDKAVEVCSFLESRGYRCWIAPRDVMPSNEYADEIIKGIEQSRCTILILSAAANESKFVRAEIERAASKGKPILPFRVEEVLPSRGLELFISSIHWIDAWDDLMESANDQLASALSGDQLSSLLTPTGVRRRNKAMRKVMFAAAAFILLVCAIVLANFVIGANVSNKANTNDHDQVKIDAASVSKDDFTFDLKLASYGKPRLLITTSAQAQERLGAIASGTIDIKGASTAHFTIGNLMPTTADIEALAKAGELSLKILLYTDSIKPHIVGPFEYKFDYKKLLIKSYKQAAEKATPWVQYDEVGSALWGRGWGLKGFEQFYPCVAAIHMGTSADDLGMRFDVPLSQSIFDSGAIQSGSSKVRTAELGVAEGVSPLFIQLEYIDGSRSKIAMAVRGSAGLPGNSTGGPRPVRLRHANVPLGRLSSGSLHFDGVGEWPNIEEIHIGTDPEELTRVIEVDHERQYSTNDLHSIQYVNNYSNNDVKVPLHWDQVYAQVKFKDGQLSEVFSIKASSHYFDGVRGVAIDPPGDVDVPEFHVSLSDDGRWLMPFILKPRGTDRVLVESGDRYISISEYVNLLQWGLVNTDSFKVLYQLKSGEEIGPITYQFKGLAHVFRANFRPKTIQNRRTMVDAYRYKTISRHYNWDHQVLMKDVVEQPSVLCVLPLRYGLWAPVIEVHLGVSEQALDNVIPIKLSQQEMFQQFQGNPPPVARLAFPIDTKHVYARFKLYDGTLTDVTEVKIKDIQPSR